MTIAQRVYEQTGNVIAPGTTGICPECKKKNFTIAGDDTFASCTNCFNRITTYEKIPPGPASIFRRFLNELYLVFAFALWRGSDRVASNAVDTLCNDWGLDEPLLRAYGIGLIPEQIDRKRLISYLPEKTEKSPLDPQKIGEAFLDEFIPVTGQIVLPHTNHQYLVTGFRSLNLENTLFRDHRISPGCFGGSLAYPTQKNETALAGNVVVIADELAWLVIQNAFIKVGMQPLTGLATGNLTMTCWETIDQLTGPDATRPLVICDASPHPAIQTLARSAQQKLTIDEYEIPVQQKINELFAPANGPAGIVKALEEAARNVNPLYRPYEEIKREIYAIRLKNSGMGNDFIVNAKVTELLIRDLRRRGRFLKNELSAYWQDGETRRIIHLNERGPDLSNLMSGIGIVLTEGLYRYLSERLITETRKIGETVDLYRFAYWSEDAATLYVDLRNGEILTLNGQDSPSIQENGANNILFLPIEDANSFDRKTPAPTESLWAPTLIDILNFNDESKLTAGDRRFLLSIYLLFMFFDSIAPTKPLVAFVGVKGSGKSMTGRIIGKILIGDTFNVASVADSKRDLETHFTNAFYVALDNADESPKKVSDLLAVACTGGQIKRRVLYTTNQMASYALKCYLVISSRTPKFKRDDICDRTIPFMLERLTEFVAESEFLDQIRDRRDALWAEILQALQQVVKLLKTNPRNQTGSQLRIADFSGFGARICKGLGLADYWRELIGRLISAQGDFALEGSPISQALKIWLQNGNWNCEKETKELFKALRATAEANNINWGYNGPQSFGQYLAGLVKPLRETMDVNVRIGHAKAKFYTFKKKTTKTHQQPKLTIPKPDVNVAPYLRNLYRYASESQQQLDNRWNVEQNEFRAEQLRIEEHKTAERAKKENGKEKYELPPISRDVDPKQEEKEEREMEEFNKALDIACDTGRDIYEVTGELQIQKPEED